MPTWVSNFPFIKFIATGALCLAYLYHACTQSLKPVEKKTRQHATVALTSPMGGSLGGPETLRLVAAFPDWLCLAFMASCCCLPEACDEAKDNRLCELPAQLHHASV